VRMCGSAYVLACVCCVCIIMWVYVRLFMNKFSNDVCVYGIIMYPRVLLYPKCTHSLRNRPSVEADTWINAIQWLLNVRRD